MLDRARPASNGFPPRRQEGILGNVGTIVWKRIKLHGPVMVLSSVVACGYPDYSGFDKDRTQDASEDQGGGEGDAPVEPDVTEPEDAADGDVFDGGSDAEDGALDVQEAGADGDDGGDAEDGGVEADVADVVDASLCQSDDDCSNDPAGPICDEGSGRCGACDTANDQCPAGEYCSSETLRCEIGCKSDQDCLAGDAGKEDPDAGADGSVGDAPSGTVTCDLVTHQCVGCSIDEDCPLGTVCESDVCVLGCTEAHGCPDGRSCCSGECLDTSEDPQNCGTCQNVCAVVAHAVVGCQGGECVLRSCEGAWADCDGAYGNGCEANTATTAAHCGSCGAVCAFANGIAQCVAGVCNFVACESGFADCDSNLDTGCETDTTSDGTNCGTCGKVCAALPQATTLCTSSSCVIGVCNEGYADCNANVSDGCEAATGTNVNSCGGCGVVCSLLNASPACTAGVCTVASCNAPYANCDGLHANGCEVNVATNTSHCGGCNSPCGYPNASAVCDTGTCQLGVCSTGWGNCDSLASTGCETQLTSDVLNCGGCGEACSVAHGVPTCTNANCQVQACSGGWGDCNGAYGDGCETPLNTLANCGGCGSACVPPNGIGTCDAGSCVIALCGEGYDDCDGIVANGCEVNSDTNVNHCGGCGVVCPSNSCPPKCSDGVCGCSSCVASGTADCDGDPGNGCEVTTLDDVNNCGGCNVVCTAPFGAPACVSGACAIASCDANRGDCNGVALDGCETSLATPLNCGVCGVPCVLPNAQESCATGTCVVTSCDAGWGNCDGLVFNGCEVNFATDPQHCGTCNLGCSVPHATAACSSGACVIGTCETGWSNCDTSQVNGCETNTGTDAVNCGSCGFICGSANGTASCSGGQCAIACNDGYGNCDGDVADGCETNTNGDVNHCGLCGNVCPAVENGTAGCSLGVCGVATCNVGYHKSGNACVPDVEICGNGVDDDLDGKVDCFDADCVADATCSGVCTNATTIGCDAYLTGQNSGAAGSTQRIAPPAYSCVAGDFAGPEYAYKLAAPADQDVFVEAYGLGGNLGIFLVDTPAGGQCTASTSCLTYGNQYTDTRPEALGFTTQAGRDYYLVVDGPSAQNYALSVQCSTAGGCFPARPIAAGMSFAGTNGSGPNSTPNHVNKYSCVTFNNSGPEGSWVFTPTVTGTYRVLVSNLTSDCDLFILSANNCDGTCLTGTTCNPSACYSVSLNKQDEEVEFLAQANRSYFVVVDGWSGNVCNFTISLTQL